MTIVNYQKKKILIHDGLEDDFLNKGGVIPCPCCNAIVNFGLYNSLDFDEVKQEKKIKMVSKMRGVKLTGNEILEFKYKDSPLRLSEKKCSSGLHDILVIFTYKEIQPARYESYLIGVFDSKDL